MQAEVKELVAIRQEIAGFEKAFEDSVVPLKLRRDTLQTQITEELKKMGVLSQRFQEATVSRAVRKTVQVVNESQAIASLKTAGLEVYVSETINSDFWNSAAKEIAKRGEVHIDGL